MSTPLRVALIASNRFPLRQPFAGGLEAHVWHLARALAEAGHYVSLFAAAGSDVAGQVAGLWSGVVGPRIVAAAQDELCPDTLN